uniref:Mitochondrial assembly of ribosomal large subunit protein 1 n=1 Tax=Daphnia galeata TaxID=27404 RepID=A0A8J2WIB6_9CRUS|nr:unnamed protein product [Daphnia galeata]
MWRQLSSLNSTTADQREGVSSRLLTFRPEILNSSRKFSEDRLEIKPDTNELLDEESWHRIGDSEEIEEFDEFEGISLQHGITGVFDIEEFVEIITKQKLDKIVVIAVPPQLNYVDYMVITTGRSPKQMTAAAEFIRKVFKRRCFQSESLPVIEGKNDKDWIALDIGNIALHIFSSKARKIYDLETLWTCGADFDDLCNQKEDVLSNLMRGHSFPSHQQKS